MESIFAEGVWKQGSQVWARVPSRAYQSFLSLYHMQRSRNNRMKIVLHDTHTRFTKEERWLSGSGCLVPQCYEMQHGHGARNWSLYSISVYQHPDLLDISVKMSGGINWNSSSNFTFCKGNKLQMFYCISTHKPLGFLDFKINFSSFDNSWTMWCELDH